MSTSLLENPWMKDVDDKTIAIGEAIIGLTMREAAQLAKVRETMVNGHEYSVPEGLPTKYFNVETRAGLIVKVLSYK